MRSAQRGPAAGLLSQLALLAALALSVGLDAPGWGVGVAYAITLCVLLSSGLLRRGRGFGPGDWVTQLRAVLVGGAAALVADSFTGSVPLALLVTLASLTILLDAADGWVARATRTTSDLGARFDMEVDAFLILAMSVYVAPRMGWWVLLLGLARYLFLVASWFLPWLRASSPPRYWSKVVAVVQGVVLTLAAADVLPRPLILIVLLVALVLLAESFGRQTWWLWRHRKEHPGTVHVPAAVPTVVAAAAVWGVLALPSSISEVTVAAFLSIPLGALLLVVAALLLPRRWHRAAAILMGVLLGALLALKVLNMGFLAVFARPFDPVNDWYYLGPGAGLLGNSIGAAGALAVVLLLVIFVAGSLVLLPLAVLRLIRVTAANRHVSARTLAAFGLAWVLFAVAGVQWAPGQPLASSGSAVFLSAQFGQLQNDLVDRGTFASEIAPDPFQDVPGGKLLAGLQGRDVMLVFVESYGRSALEGSSYSPGVEKVLAAGTHQLEAAGFSSRSGFLTSSTFGGASWLAHATLQSGLWVDSQQRYNQLLTSNRLTLSRAFSQAGWRTVSVVPSDTVDWPQGRAFYGFDALYDSRNVGYRGPKFSYATMPDQYVLSSFQRLELAAHPRPPIMAEIDLVSSHTPWTPLPHLVPWDEVGDGTVFSSMPAQGDSPESIAGDPARIKELYGQSIQYSLNTLFSFITAHADPNLVLIVLGDHQPHAEVSGDGAGHDVPISIIAADPSVLDQISSWGWQEGMLPNEGAPVWPMSAFRDRFLAAYSAGVTPEPSPPAEPGADVVHSTDLPSPG
ncbi:CDP-alcohol phosphatidyltransferase family protein [Arthrobacter sp.]|uniref:CDP-alcohol phosphatidyltransferase family protein n=1 Tax=Arthrobacter sp. TaxID=1667 RepID=UPI0026DEC590|nr:CDP-alcohol phosphatidyltransferase family protein [Arthrobacter sp.]MDO5753522.1 CDP-alcohol phosphatidyltransferase family protein [Arthrobacter sp.]